MEIEQLKMVIELISQLGVHGKEAFIWWLVLDKVLPVIGWGITLVAFSYTILKVIKEVSGHENHLQSIRDVLGVGCPGKFMPSEYHDVMRKIRQLLDK